MSITETPMSLLTFAEAAAELRISRATAYRLIDSGEIPAHRVGGSIRIDRDERLAALMTPMRVEDDGETR